MSNLFPDPKRAPSRMDRLALGEDCAIHPLLGCVVANNGVPPEQQARDFLYSLYNATEQNVAGRAGDFSAAEYREWLHKLAEWHETNAVPLPAPIVSHPIALGLDDEAKRRAHMAKQYAEQKLRDEEAAAAAHAAAAAMTEAQGKPVH